MGISRIAEQFMTYKPKKTKDLVKIPAFVVAALTPNASKAVRMTKTVVQPW
jgi:hypothetical protein